MDTAAPRKFSASDGLAAVAGLVLAGVVIWTASDSPDPDPSLATALSRLAGDPLDTDALRVVGLDRAWRGDIRGATRLLSFVESRTWRDGPAEVWLLGHRLDRHDYDGALKAADSLLRRDPDGEVRPVLFPALTALAAYPEARPALSARLAKSPWWRDRFLTVLATHGEAVGARRVFADLAGGPTPPSPDDYAPFINRLVADQDHAGALAAWREIARPPGGASDNLAFSDVSDHTPFTWSPAAGVGATSETTALGGATTLRTDYDGFSTPDLPSRLLVLAPGSYRLTWRDKVAGTSDRLTWRLRCADTGRVIGQAQTSPGETPAGGAWVEKSLTAEVPADSCRAQWLELAASPGERRAPGTLWSTGMTLRSGP